MADWQYIRMTGKQGAKGTELMVLYSAQNSVSPNDDPDRYYWHTSFQPTDFFMCTKAEDSELWGNIMKIVGEGLTVQYSADGSTNWHNPPAVATDKYMRQKMDSDSNWGAVKKIVGEDGEDGANGSNIWYSSASATTSTTSIEISTITTVSGRTLAVGDLVIASGLVFSITAKSSTTVTVSYKEDIKGADGANAVVMTSTSKPDGTYTNQVGFYQTTGKFYRWTGSVWSEIPMATPSDISTLTPRYIGAFSSAPTASNYNAGDGYLNTSNSKLYIKVGSTWSEQSSVTESNRNMYNLAMKDMLNLAGATGTVAEYATAFVENLFADKATINELQSMSVLFKDYCGSIMSQNPNIGDTMIYMGKNPRLSSVTREFEFGLSQYLGKVGETEMWKKYLRTFLLGSALTLGVLGCVQTTDEVYSGGISVLTETNVYEEATSAGDIDFFPRIVIVSSVGIYVGGIISGDGGVYMTQDWQTFTYIHQFDETVSSAQFFKGELYFAMPSGIYKTQDMNTYTKVASYNVSRITRWQKHNILFAAGNNNTLYYTTDGTNWSSLFQSHWSNELHFGFIINDSRVIISASLMEPTLEYIALNDLGVPTIYTISNPFYYNGAYGVPAYTYVIDNEYRAVLQKTTNGVLDAQYSVVLSSDLRMIGSPIQIGNLKTIIGASNLYIYLSESILYGGVKVSKLKLSDGTEETLTSLDSEWMMSAGRLSDTFGYVYTAHNGIIKGKVTFDGGGKWKDIKIPNGEWNSLSIFNIESAGVYYFSFTSASGESHIYTTRGREAGSGIIDESFGTEQNYTLNSNGQLMQWGKQTFNRNVDGGNNVAGTAITFPKEFKSEPVVSVTHFNGNQFNMTVRDVSTTGFTPVYRNVNNTSNANTQGCYWIAIGT